MARASIDDPLKAFRFRVAVDQFDRAGFSEVEIGKMSFEEVAYREGGMNDTEQFSAGLQKFDPITLIRGLLLGSQRGGDFDFVIWVNQVGDVGRSGNAPSYRRDIDIKLYDNEDNLANTLHVLNAWPKDYTPMSKLEGGASKNHMESLVLRHEGWQWDRTS